MNVRLDKYRKCEINCNDHILPQLTLVGYLYIQIKYIFIKQEIKDLETHLRSFLKVPPPPRSCSFDLHSSEEERAGHSVIGCPSSF